MPRVDFALLTDRRFEAPEAPPGDWYYENILAEDRLLTAALAERGLTWERVDWARPGVDWGRFRRAVFRTTWDYFDRFDQFGEWLDAVVDRTTLVNPEALIRWNLDKRYLLELSEAGIPTVPTLLVERGSDRRLSDLLSAEGWGEAVIKPAVSGAGRETHRIRAGGSELEDARFSRLSSAEAMLVQPFQHDVLAGGEVTLVLVDGAVTHAVRKVAAPGEFRVQDDHGGRVLPHEPDPAEVEVAERAFAHCAPTPVYGRVDLVRGADGELLVMELELIEPELFLRFGPPAAERLAEALHRSLASDRPPGREAASRDDDGRSP